MKQERSLNLPGLTWVVFGIYEVDGCFAKYTNEGVAIKDYSMFLSEHCSEMMEKIELLFQKKHSGDIPIWMTIDEAISFFWRFNADEYPDVDEILSVLSSWKNKDPETIDLGLDKGLEDICNIFREEGQSKKYVARISFSKFNVSYNIVKVNKDNAEVFCTDDTLLRIKYDGSLDELRTLDCICWKNKKYLRERFGRDHVILDDYKNSRYYLANSSKVEYIDYSNVQQVLLYPEVLSADSEIHMRKDLAIAVDPVLLEDFFYRNNDLFGVYGRVYYGETLHFTKRCTSEEIMKIFSETNEKEEDIIWKVKAWNSTFSSDCGVRFVFEFEGEKSDPYLPDYIRLSSFGSYKDIELENILLRRIAKDYGADSEKVEHMSIIVREKIAQRKAKRRFLWRLVLIFAIIMMGCVFAYISGFYINDFRAEMLPV